MVIGKSKPGGVDTRRAVVLRPFSSRLMVIGGLIAGIGVVGPFLGGGGWWGRTLLLVALQVLPIILYWWLWYRLAVRLQPSGLVVRSLFSCQTIRWEEIGGVRLTLLRSSGRFSYYGPMLNLLSGEEKLLGELSGPTTESRLPRSLPARHVATIASYLNHYQTHDQRQIA